MSSGHGGKRRKHTPTLLTPQQVEDIRVARAASVSYKELMKKYRCSYTTVSRAALGRRTYAKVALDGTARTQALVEDAAKWRAHVEKMEDAWRTMFVRQALSDAGDRELCNAISAHFARPGSTEELV